ncbi:branched-chain amino acid ABC transporter permease [Hoeflea poritis]|uniref:Branched-chain amino acid ABC transporter permease n=1 Tax=Hoeflea poritis TaxID=2993659 RepID=A0ABT4VNV7_9HYPH|nr:branched-chain amino acid ABC transporter permease [Hoeflea poritis]MDA4846385.1 branched-chain amino acid ABC transporter permease [Hoeflea poritis]
MAIDTFIFVLISGIVLGGLYALMAVGLSVVWTTLDVFNFAHGAFVALGAYVAWQISQSAPGPAGFALAAALSVAFMFAFGFCLHFGIIKPFERSPNIVLLAVITTLAASSIIENGIQLVWGPREKQIDPNIDMRVDFGGVAIAGIDLLSLAVALLALAGLAVFLRRSATGRAMRAAAQNREAAELMGFNVAFLFAIAFGIAAATAALAGVFIGSLRFINPSFGADPLMKSLIVVIFGGVAQFTSPIYAAFIIGIVEAFSIYFLGLYWAPAVLFALMIAVLMIKPEGLFGNRQKTL